ALQLLLRQVRKTGEQRRIYVGADGRRGAASLASLSETDNAVVNAFATGEELLAAIAEQQPDCVVLPAQLADMTAPELLQKASGRAANGRGRKPAGHEPLPIFLLADDSLDKKTRQKLKTIGKNLDVRTVGTPDRLREEIHNFFHPPI